MKKIYGLMVLILLNISAAGLYGQFYFYEDFDFTRKIVIGLVAALIVLWLDSRVIRVLSRKIKKGMPEKKMKRALSRLKRKKHLTNFLITILCMLLAAGNYYYYRTNQMLEAVTFAMEPTEMNGYIYVMKNSPLYSLETDTALFIGFDQEERSTLYSLISAQMEKKYNITAYYDYTPEFISPRNDVYQHLKNGTVDAIVIGDEALEDLKKTYPQFEQDTRLLGSLTAKTGVNSLPVDVQNESFNVLIMGVDIREGEGDIYSRTRTDTLMVASFNPLTMKACLISIPRDSYVEFADGTGEKDKITHAGTQGVGCTIETVEALLDIDINYYAKFNFQALVSLVDALDGIEVDVQYSFTEQDSVDTAEAIALNEGLQILDGEEALAYARHRKTQNDHVRNASQQQILKAILSKLASLKTVTRIDDILNVMKGNMTTNLSRNELLSLVGLIPKLGSLQMTTTVIAGVDLEEYVPRYDQVLWITELDDEAIDDAHNMIEEIMQKSVSHTYP